MTLPQGLVPRPSRTPKTPAPDGACDSHIHMLAGRDEAPLWDSRVEDPAPNLRYADFMAAYIKQMQDLGISRTVVVQSILYGTDNSVTAQAVADLNALKGYAARGIGLVTDAATDADLDRLVAQNLVGVRLNYVHGGVLSWAGVQAMAPRLAARGLHVQMLINTHRHMVELAPQIAALPVPVVLDHIGWPDLALGPDEPGFQALLNLLKTGNVFVKLSGLYRLCPPPYVDADAFVVALVSAAPTRCLWGSDWPHIMLADAEQPDSATLLEALARVCPDEETWHQILVDTPAALYQF